MSSMQGTRFGWGWPLAVGVLIASTATAACGDDDGGDGSMTVPGGVGGSGGPVDVQATFPSACVGTLTKASVVSTPGNLPSSWHSSSDTPNAAVGTRILFEEDPFGASALVFRGYTFASNGQPQRLTGASSSSNLTIDVDFTSTCAAPFTTELTTLRTVTIYAAKDLSGTPCTLPAGTRLGNLGYGLGDGGVGGVFSGKLPELCGFDQGYSKDYLAASIAYEAGAP
jgi:hypothetical protein